MYLLSFYINSSSGFLFKFELNVALTSLINQLSIALIGDDSVNRSFPLTFNYILWYMQLWFIIFKEWIHKATTLTSLIVLGGCLWWFRFYFFLGVLSKKLDWCCRNKITCHNVPDPYHHHCSNINVLCSKVDICWWNAELQLWVLQKVQDWTILLSMECSRSSILSIIRRI